MIKIIKPGNVEKKVAVCPKCGCIFSFSNEDLLRRQLELFCAAYIFIKCPCCYHEITEWSNMEGNNNLSSDNLPDIEPDEPIINYY